MNTNNRFTTPDREIVSLPDGLVDLTRRVVKLEDGLCEIQITLDAQTETLTKLGRVQDSILIPLECFATVHAQVADRVTRLEAVTESPFPNVL